MMIFQRISSIATGTVLPGTRYTVKGLGKRRRAPALVYRIPSRTRSRTHYEKGVTQDEFEQAYKQLVDAGEITRKWFSTSLSACSKDGPCNFIAIGQTFVLLDEAVAGRGKFTRKATKTGR